MIPGTRPARRSARAVSLPARERAAALIRLTVAMIYPRLKPCHLNGISRQPPGVQPGMQRRIFAPKPCFGAAGLENPATVLVLCRGRGAYSGAGLEKQGTRRRAMR